MMLAALLLAFSFTPTGHGLPPKAPPETVKPFFVASMQRVVPVDALGFNPIETATPVLDAAQTRLYLATHDGRIRCLFRGKPSWVFKMNGGALAAPILEAETLFVAGGDGVVYALNRFTGAVRWQVDLNEELTTSPTLSEGRLFVMSSAQSVTALDAKDGKRLWKFHRDAPGGFTIRGDARPVVANRTVYTGFADGWVVALGAADGVARWSRPVSGVGDYLDIDWIEAPENDSRIYVASAKAGILALDAGSGDLVWSFALAGANHVLVDGPRIIAGGRSSLVALSRSSGKQSWKLTLGKDEYPTQPVVVSGLIVVAADRGPLLMVDEETGEARGAFNPGPGFSMQVLAVPHAAYAISNGGALYSLGLVP
jgi:outer membrane protein assembly factor BamB